jgi:iron complex outermembrane receptor protein
MELTQQSNLELETGFLNNRLFLTTAYYHKLTQDMWLPVPVSREGLLVQEIQQLGRVRNQGWEGKLTYGWYRGDWQTSFGLTLSYNQNRVLEMEQESQVVGEQAGLPAWLLIETGQPLGTIYGYRTLADGQLASERSVLGNALPSWTYGVPLEISWRNFSLNLLLHGFSGQDVLRLPGEVNAQTPLTDAWLSKGRFLRCQQLQFSFHVPSHHLRGVKGMRVQLQGDNLWLLSGYEGYDPEVNAFSQNRMLLSSIDQAVFPRSSRISLGVKLDW